MNKDDEQWFQILSGEHVNDAKPDTRREAEVLRSVLTKYNQSENSERDELAHARGLKKILHNFEQKGIFDEPKQKLHRSWYAGLASVATVAALSFMFILESQVDPLRLEVSPGFLEPSIMRSGITEQPVDTDDFPATSIMMRQQLSKLRLPYRFTPVGKDSWQLEFNIPFEPSQDIQIFLKEWHLKETENGWILVVPKLTST